MFFMISDRLKTQACINQLGYLELLGHLVRYDKRMEAKAAEEAAQEAAKASKRAKVKDENAPKRNMSASAQAPLELET